MENLWGASNQVKGYIKVIHCLCTCSFCVELYRNRPPPTKPARAKPIRPPQTSTAGVRHGGQQWFSSTEVGRYGCWQRILDSDEHWTKPICLYIHKTWDLYPLQVRSKISIPTHNTKPTTDSGFYLQATSAFAATVPPRSDLQGIVSASIAWWLIRLPKWVTRWLVPRIFSLFGF